MNETIDQLLSYVTWRDTKTSIILFSKNKDLSAVVEKAKESIESHSCFKGTFSIKDAELLRNETVAGFKLSHPSDSKKEVFLTLMAFQITSP